MDHIGIIKKLVDEMLSLGFGDRYSARYNQDSENAIMISIEGDGLSYLIGQQGRTLLALQSLIRQMYMHQTGDYSERVRIIIDIGDYKANRVRKIQDLARKSVEKLVEMKEKLRIPKVTLPVMNSFERHIVHQFIQDNYPEIKSSSHGEDPNRRVVLTFVEDSASNS